MADWMERAKQKFTESTEGTTDVTDERALTSVMAVPQIETFEDSDSNVSNVSTSDEKYQDIALKCLRKLQTQHEKNLASGGYDPSDARVLITDWITECARAGLSSHRLDAVKPFILTAVKIENNYIRELPQCRKEEPPMPMAVEIEQLQSAPRVDLAHQQLSVAIRDMPVTLEEALGSPLFDEFDLDQISKGNMSKEGLRMYIASWLIADKHFPYVLHHDWQDRLHWEHTTTLNERN